MKFCQLCLCKTQFLGTNALNYSEYELLISVPAYLRVIISNKTTIKGQSVNLSCTAYGDKAISISWSFNGAALSWQNDPR